MKENKKYYVYCFLDPFKKGNFVFDNYQFKHLPFYIGKGQGTRIKEHFFKASLKRDSNKKKVNKILKIRRLGAEPIGYKIQEGLSENKALEKEQELIKLIGRADLNLGTLTNLTNGGDIGIKFRDLNKSIQKKLKKERSDRMLKNNPMKNSDTAQKVSIYRKNIKHSEEYKKDMSISLKKSLKHKDAMNSKKVKEKIKDSKRKYMKPVAQYDLDMGFIKKFESINEASRKLCIRKGDISAVINDRQNTCKGFIFKLC